MNKKMLFTLALAVAVLHSSAYTKSQALQMLEQKTAKMANIWEKRLEKMQPGPKRDRVERVYKKIKAKLARIQGRK